MAKIFIAFYNGLKNADSLHAMPIFYEAFCDGLKQHGNDVLVIMHSYWNKDLRKIPSSLLQRIQNFNPDLIILFNNAFYDLSKNFDCPIVIYDVDSPLFYANKEILKQNPDRYIFFENQESACETLKSDFRVPAKNIRILPFFSEVKAEDVEQKHNICFIGTKFGCNGRYCLHKFMDTKPSDDERKEYLRLMHKVEEHPQWPLKKLLEDVRSKKIKNCFNLNDIITILSAYKRNQTLAAVEDLGLDIWGTPNWANENFGFPYLNYHAEPIYSLAHNQEIYNISKIGISIAHVQAKEAFPWRILDIMASNACLVTDYHEGFAKYFPELKLPCFNNQFEARDWCIKLLKDPAMRRDIVLQSQEIVNKKYRFKNTLQIMQDYLGISLEAQGEGKLLFERLEKILKWQETTNEETAQKRGVNQYFENRKHISIWDKYCYKIWKHLDKKLKKKGLI